VLAQIQCRLTEHNPVWGHYKIKGLNRIESLHQSPSVTHLADTQTTKGRQKSLGK